MRGRNGHTEQLEVTKRQDSNLFSNRQSVNKTLTENEGAKSSEQCFPLFVFNEIHEV